LIECAHSCAKSALIVYHSEDAEFVEQAINAGFKVAGKDGNEFSALHVVHPGNISFCFPRYRLPRFLLDRLFPHFELRLMVDHLSPDHPSTPQAYQRTRQIILA
jgi:hypothetical protein